MKLEKKKSIIDLNMDLNELIRETFGLGEPILDMSLSFEQSMERFLKDLSGRKRDQAVRK